MSNSTTAYCENKDCRVVLYEVNGATNCPGCGLFGRLKDEDKS
jgi:hypothetical protein